MATRIRQQSTAPAPSQQRRPGADLPPYEAPTFSLNPAAQRALAQLSHAHSLRKLDESLLDAQAALSINAAEINERLTQKETNVKKRKAEIEQQSSQDAENNGEELEQSLSELRDKVERMTQRMDESMRKMIDGQHSVQFIKDSVAATAEDARAHASTQASTQGVRPRRQSRRRSGNDEDAEEEADEDYEDFTPTDPTGGAQAQQAPLDAFKAKMDDAKTRYQSHSLTDRYADNNSFRDFRRLVHDARYGEEGPPLPHHSEWFNEGAAPAPGVTTRARTNADDDDDDDIAVERATISTKCPLTLQEFVNPVASKKCPHSFEREAIMSMISNSTTHEGREEVVQCPVSGCAQKLTRNDLHVDAVLIRKIKRIQRAKQLEGEEAEDAEEDGQGNATLIDDEDGADVDDIVEDRNDPKTQPKAEPKAEPKGTAAPSRPPANVPPKSSAAVVNLGSSSDEEEAEEDATQWSEDD